MVLIYLTELFLLRNEILVAIRKKTCSLLPPRLLLGLLVAVKKITAAVRWRFLLENTFNFAGGGVGSGRLSLMLLRSLHNFSRLATSLLGYYKHCYVFSFIRIYLFSLLTSWIFISLLVFSLLHFSLLVTALLCLVTPGTAAPAIAEFHHKKKKNI